MLIKGIHVVVIRKTRAALFLAVFLLVLLFCTIILAGRSGTRYVFSTNSPEYKTVMKEDLLCLMVAYWPYAKGVQETADGRVFLVMQSGTRILYDDKKVKSAEEKFNNADLQDMLEQIYPLNGPIYLRSLDFDPGRYRVYKLFDDVYGNTQAKIESNLVSVGFGSSVLRFNERNSAAAMLKKADSELNALLKKRPSLSSFIYPSSGTYKYRNIAGTNLLSAHSFGTAIDLAAKGNDYWQWASRADGQKRLAIYPSEVVGIFESNNFIWGGRWGHFDMMHYEYRPEMILKARYFSKIPGNGEPWYTGSPFAEDVHIRNYVAMIDSALK